MRIALTILLPLLFPLIAYALWLKWGRYRLRRNGEDLPALNLAEIPWLWLFIMGAILATVAVAVTFFDEGGAPGSTYVPPQLKDGKIAPGHFENQTAKP